MNLTFTPDFIGLLVAAFLTLCIFSYLLGGDFFLYRLAVAILVGGGAAYVLVAVVVNVIIPRVFLRMVNPANALDRVFAAIALLMGTLIFTKVYQRPTSLLVWLGNISVAYLVGVGAGVAIGGAAFGTLFAQSQAAATFQGSAIPGQSWLALLLNPISPFVMLAITLAVLLSFTFLLGARRGLGSAYARLVQPIASFGRAALAIAFGAIFASTYIASVSVLISRVRFIIELSQQILKAIGG
ncbi:MAG: hypothetical protein JW850_14025 [Thermoflexales bacterium]|nr:hypothetical protein [Thermoflexales bacterium]